MFRADDLRKLFRPDAYRHLAQHDPLTESLAALQHGQKERRSDVPGDRNDWLAALQYRDLHTYLPLDILTKVDRATMAHSLEARPPLLDHRLVEFAATVPARFRLRDDTTKYLFKQAMRGILPDAIIDRQKHGFAVPLATWLRGDLAGFARDLLMSNRCRQRGFFDPGYLQRLIDLNNRGRNLDLQLWTVMSFELWCQRFLDPTPRAQPAPIRQTRRVPPAIVRVPQTT
jgi:asparagine synthase (glutamine-hydrolysing)